MGDFTEQSKSIASVTRYVYEGSEDEMSTDNDTFEYQSGLSH